MLWEVCAVSISMMTNKTLVTKLNSVHGVQVCYKYCSDNFALGDHKLVVADSVCGSLSRITFPLAWPSSRYS